MIVGLDPRFADIDQKIVEIFMKKARIEDLLNGRPMKKEGRGEWCLDFDGFPVVLSKDEKKEYKEEVRVYEKILADLETKRSELLANKDTHQDSGLLENKFIILDIDHQIIQVGGHMFGNFNLVFSLFDGKISIGSKKKSQLKGGSVLIYAIGKYIRDDRMTGNENKTILIAELLPYIKEFREKWNIWEFEKSGTKKESISKTDCESANSIFLKCGLRERLRLGKNQREILFCK